MRHILNNISFDTLQEATLKTSPYLPGILGKTATAQLALQLQLWNSGSKSALIIGLYFQHLQHHEK